MGLDQYAFVEVDEPLEFAYWRKHPNLQGWMENLWRKQNPESEEDFNCINLYLTKENIEELESTILNNRLPETSGFFFGQDSDEYYKEKDLEFISKAKEYLAKGYKIYYGSWW